MVRLDGFVHGIYPKSEKLRVRIGRWERGSLSADELNDLIAEETTVYEDLFEGHALHTDPLFSWYDIFRPVVLMSSGMDLGPLTRFEETNTFYRIPQLHGPPSLRIPPDVFHELPENPPLPLYHSRKDPALFLPGPETLFRFSRNVGNLERRTFLEATCRIYAGIVTKLKPARTFIMERVKVDGIALEAISRITDPSGIMLFTTGNLEGNTFSGKQHRFHSIIVDPTGSNLQVARDHSTVPGIKLVDGHNTRMESVDEIRKKAEELSRGMNIERMIVANSDYLDFLPRKIADQKVKLLAGLGE
jgi:5-methyltetrahydropteroyltriglutamate--homocysteine methyltransferase